MLFDCVDLDGKLLTLAFCCYCCCCFFFSLSDLTFVFVLFLSKAGFVPYWHMRATVLFLITSGGLFLGLAVCLAVGLPILMSGEHEASKQVWIGRALARANLVATRLRVAQPQMLTIGLAVCANPTRSRFEESVDLLRQMSVVGTLSWVSIVARTPEARAQIQTLINVSYGINVTIVSSNLSSLDAVVTFL